jgi:lipopolysaccharide transport system ATP-binding protein
MYVRLAFAVAAHLEPEILIVDEVLAVGDAQFQKKCLGKMEDVGKEGRTVIFVSHQMGTIMSLCEKCLLMKSGNLEFEGSSSEAIKRYMNQGMEESNKSFSQIDKGDKYSKLKSIEIIDEHGHQTDALFVGKTFGLRARFSTLGSNCNPKPNFLVSASDGTKLFHSIDVDNDFRNLGEHFSTAWFKPNILNEGSYNISFALATLNPVEIHASTEFSIEVSDNLNDKSRGDYKGKVHGYLRGASVKWELN